MISVIARPPNLKPTSSACGAIRTRDGPLWPPSSLRPQRKKAMAEMGRDCGSRRMRRSVVVAARAACPAKNSGFEANHQRWPAQAHPRDRWQPYLFHRESAHSLLHRSGVCNWGEAAPVDVPLENPVVTDVSARTIRAVCWCSRIDIIDVSLLVDAGTCRVATPTRRHVRRTGGLGSRREAVLRTKKMIVYMAEHDGV